MRIFNNIFYSLLSSGDEDKSVINLDESEEVGATTSERNKERRIGRSPSLTPPIIDPAEKLHARRIVLEYYTIHI